MDWEKARKKPIKRKAISTGVLERLTGTQRLQAELLRLRRRLQNYESSSERRKIQPKDEDKKRIRKIFDMFDVDKSGDLDAKEFQELAFMLGETLTLNEVQERIKIIDQDDNGLIDFDEFYQWWLSPDHDYLKMSRGQDSLRLLKAKLRSKAMMRTISMLNEKAAATLKSSPSLTIPMDQQPNDANSPVPEGIARVNVKIEVGKVVDVPCHFKLDFVRDEERAEQLRSSLGVIDEESAIFSLCFTVKEGVSDFDLGEVSGSLKTLLSFAKKEVQFNSSKISLCREEDTKLFRIDVVMDKHAHKTFTEFCKFFQAIHPKYLTALLELSQSPRQQNLDQPLDFKFSVNGEMNKSSVDLMKELIGLESSSSSDGDEEKDQSDVEASDRDGAKRVESMGMLIFHALSVLRSFSVDMQMGNMEEFISKLASDNKTFLYQQLGLKESDPFPVNVYALFKPYMSFYIAWELIKMEEDPEWKDIPPELLEEYYAGLHLFEGIHSAGLQIGSHCIALSTKGFDIFRLLPSLEELKDNKKRLKEISKRLNRSGGSHHGSMARGSSRENVFRLSNEFTKEEEEEEFDMSNYHKVFVCTGPADKNGIIYFLDYKVNEPPKVLASSLGKGTHYDFIERDNVFCWTLNQKNSWFAVDLGQGRRAIPHKYALRYGSSGSYCCPRNWKLQGAVKLSQKMGDVDSTDWVTLLDHQDDKTLNSPFVVGLWDIPDPKTTTGFRYFRVIMTGPNCYVNPPDKEDLWSNVFVANGFELYGAFFSTEESEQEDDPHIPGDRLFRILYDNDNNGIIYYLRRRGVKLNVTASSIARGQPRDFIKRGEVYCWSQNRPFSWFMVDFGPLRRITPNYYSFRYGSGGSACCPRNWLLQGANELTDQTSNPDSEDWTTLSAHKNDSRIKGDHCVLTQEINDTGGESFRFFRIIQTGPNSFTGGSGWKDVFVASGLELYGTLHTLEGAREEVHSSSEDSEVWEDSQEDFDE